RRTEGRASLLLLLPARLYALGVSGLGGLARARDGQSARLDIVGDHAPGRNERAVADGHRRDQRGVHHRAHALADRGAVLVAPVVVGGDRAGAEVATGADVGVADVTEVR